MKPWMDRALISVIGLTLMFAMAMSAKEEILSGKNDFAPLYNGTQLLGSTHLYSAEHNYELLEVHVGGTNDSLRYTRLPYHAAIFWPLGRLPYLTAYALWVAIGFGALVGFALLWRMPSGMDAVAFTALSLPAFQSLMNGQDTPLLLLWIALALYLESKGKPFASGCVFALCAAKYHLFALLPLLLLAQKRWSMLKGLAAGGGVLLAISFAAGGLRWPVEYYLTLTDSRVHPETAEMPNLHGLFADAPFSLALQFLFTVAIAVGAWRVARRSSFHHGLAVALTGGLLISYHAYLSDCALLLPAAMIIYTQTENRWLQLLAAVLLTPFVYFFILAPPPASHVLQLTISAFFAMSVAVALRKTRSSDEAPPALAAVAAGR